MQISFESMASNSIISSLLSCFGCYWLQKISRNLKLRVRYFFGPPTTYYVGKKSKIVRVMARSIWAGKPHMFTIHGENFMAIFTTLSVIIWFSTGTLGIFATLVYVFTMRVVINVILSMAIIPTLLTSILFCNLCYMYTIMNFTTQCGENRHTDTANLATLINKKKLIHCLAIFIILYGNYYPAHGEFKLICIGKFTRRT